MQPPNIPDLILADFETDNGYDELPYLATSVADGIYAGHVADVDDDPIAPRQPSALSMNRKLSWVHVPVWVIAEAVTICKTYPKSVAVKKRFKEHRPHKPVFSLAEMIANKYLDHIGEGLRFVQCTFPGNGSTHVTITVHGGGLHRLMLDSEDHPWVTFLFELMLKDDWLKQCALLASHEVGIAGRKRPVLTVYRDISNGYIHAGSKWSYTYG